MLYNDEVTLEEILLSRDKRSERQSDLISEYNLPLISFTVNMPGARKKTPLSIRVFEEGYNRILETLKNSGLKTVYKEQRLLNTGSEAYIVVDIDENKLKELTLQLENTHPLGRIWDFDIIVVNGRSISRENMNYPKRKCFICEEEAHACARSRRHSVDELVEKIEKVANDYFESKK